jgi:hypothetical protein
MAGCLIRGKSMNLPISVRVTGLLATSQRLSVTYPNFWVTYGSCGLP